MTVHAERNMENKYTTGPWNVEKCRYGFAVYASKTGDVVVKTEDAEGRYGAIDNEADARLIAAAPELLAALKGMEKWASSIYDGYPPSTASIAAAPYREAARAAIAKATGEVK
jgi:hypothetical protein